MKKECDENKFYYLLFGGSMITKTVFILFSTFWLLFITSFIGTKVKDEKEAQDIYANVMIVGIIFGLIGMPFAGMFCDRVSPTKAIPVAFLSRFFAIIIFMFVKDPTSFGMYFSGILILFGTSFETISTDSMIMRNAQKEIRGTIYGTAMAFGYIGQFIFCLVGGFLFDYVNPYAPFFFVGLVDLSYALMALWCGYKGILIDDHALRKLREHKSKEAIQSLKQGEAKKTLLNDQE